MSTKISLKLKPEIDRKPKPKIPLKLKLQIPHDPLFNYKQLTDKKLDIQIYTCFLSINEADQLFQQLKNQVQWPKPLPSYRRINATYGDLGLVYIIKFPNGTVYRKAIPWETLPVIIPYRDRITKLIGHSVDTCVIQWYPFGRIGIKPHRDKEMVHGTSICGISLGSTRKLEVSNGHITHEISCNHGSLYILNPPTNDYYTHSIPVESEISDPRISLTFRNYRAFSG
jgi:alpha-ketoglutarate-dependent dioxygenase alkB family protein 2